MDISDIQTLYAYNRWANQRMFSALEQLNGDQFTAPVASSFPSIRETVFHILGAEWIWLKRWQGISPRATAGDANVNSETMSRLTPVKVPAVQELWTVAALRSFADAIEGERQEFLATVTEDRLPAPLQFSDMAGNAALRATGAVVAAFGESRYLSSWAGNHFAASGRRRNRIARYAVLLSGLSEGPRADIPRVTVGRIVW